jgi:hypothetical protein
MVQIKRKTKNTVTITSDKFELCKQLIGQSRRSTSIAHGGRYYAFQGDNPLKKDFDDPAYGVQYHSKLALANFVLGMRLWKEGIAECNEWMEKNARDPKMSYKADVPGEDVPEEVAE